MKRLLLALWGLWCIAMAGWCLPLADRAWAGDLDGYGHKLALVLWVVSSLDAACGAACLAAAVWPRRKTQ